MKSATTGYDMMSNQAAGSDFSIVSGAIGELQIAMFIHSPTAGQHIATDVIEVVGLARQIFCGRRWWLLRTC